MGVDQDQAFREVVRLVYGDGAGELIRKANPDGADLHGAAAEASASRKKKEKTQARVGLASNIVGLGAGVGGTAAALRDPRLKKHKATRGIHRAGKKIPSPLASKGGKAGAILAGGALGLQLTNIAGDAVANRVLARSAKKDPRVKGGTMTAVRVASSETKKLPERVTTTKEHIGKRGGLLSDPPKFLQGGKDAPQRRPPANPTPEQKARRGRLLAMQQTKVKKSEEVDVTWEGEIAKTDMDKQQLFGWASVIEIDGEPIVDLQGDRISTDEMEKSAYEYVVKSRKGGDMHLRDEWHPVQKSDMIESFMVTPEKRSAMGLPDSVPTGWWVGFQVNDSDVWAKVRSGERTGFSIHGKGKRSPG